MVGVSLGQNSGVTVFGQGSAWQLVGRAGLGSISLSLPLQAHLEPDVDTWVGCGLGHRRKGTGPGQQSRAELGWVDWELSVVCVWLLQDSRALLISLGSRR